MAVETIAIVGAGAWGTALANVAAGTGRHVRIWAFETEVAVAINEGHENSIYLPGVSLVPGIEAVSDLGALKGSDAFLLVTPAQHLRAISEDLRPHIADAPAVVCAKGIEADTGLLMTEVLDATLPGTAQAVLSGPTFASEVAAGHPTAVTIAARDAALAGALAAALGSPRFRPYAAADTIGAQIGGAVKNVMAIACGIVAGRGFGQNARAALITRGLAEMTRLAVAKGAEAETLMGLSGLGDLTLTCTSTTSRNYSLGLAIGEGNKARDVLAGKRSVAEGAYTAGPVVSLAKQLDIEMPVSAAIDAIINHDADLDSVIEGLLARPYRREGIDG
jgi:glycerol-3-phosphate dehydrogenase (NAD(P)+)